MPPRRAATVMVLRDRADGRGPDVHLLRRRVSMAFAGGVYAFPGGGVDPRDEGAPRAGAGDWGARLGLDAPAAQAVVCAAVRETFEETGVLLAGPPGGQVVADTTGPDWEADRAALVAHELAFADFLDRRGLYLHGDLLRACGRWITPEFEERRYDTWFFLAALPEGQRARDVSGEADRTAWMPAADAVAGYDRGELTMLPPTITMLRALLPYGSAAEALAGAARSDLSPVMADATVGADGSVVLTWPDRTPDGGAP